MAKPASYDFLTGYIILYIKNEIFMKFIEGLMINDIQDLDWVEIYCLCFIIRNEHYRLKVETLSQKKKKEKKKKNTSWSIYVKAGYRIIGWKTMEYKLQNYVINF